MAEHDNNEPEEIIITGDSKEDSSSGGKGKNEGSGGDSDSDGGGTKIENEAPEEGEKKENNGGSDSEGGEGENGKPSPKENEDEDGDEEDDETIELVDCAIIGFLERGAIAKVNKNDIKVENQPIRTKPTYFDENNYIKLPLKEIILENDYVAYKIKSKPNVINVGKVTSFVDNNDVEKNELNLFEYNSSTGEYTMNVIKVSDVRYKMPNCAIIKGKYKGRVGCFYENDKDSLGFQQIELFENSGGNWRGNAVDREIIGFDLGEYVTFGDNVIVSRESREYKCKIEPRFISWGTPSSNDSVGDNYVWVTHKDFNSVLWEAVSDIVEIDYSNDNQGIFESLTIQIIDDIISQFKEKGTMPEERDNFLYCHLPKAIRKSVNLLERANGMDNQRLDVEIKTTIETIREFDREVAKSLLRHIQTSGYNFDPIDGFGSIFYNCLKELGVFNMTNTALIQDGMTVVSIYRDKNKLFFYSTIGYVFMEEIIFGDRKNITKFALWQNERAERIDALYSLLNFLVYTSRDDDKTDNVKYPEINEEIGRIFLLQLKALQDAI